MESDGDHREPSLEDKDEEDTEETEKQAEDVDEFHHHSTANSSGKWL